MGSLEIEDYIANVPTAKGLGVRYQWTSPDDARSLAPEYKKALEFSSEASVSNLHYLDQYRRRNQVPLSGGEAVFCASVDKVGRRDRI
ncbi:MAG: hypothetical protein JNM39_18620 [Bdellovibrionaceae bacterium]|nr:hypothetical protein [Pseudobdellovibrionaceae bacterium]